MSEAKHTKGEWNAAENYSQSGAECSWAITSDDGCLIGNAVTFYPDRTVGALEELEANARLFAASKDLLAACEGENARWLVWFPEGFDAARASYKLNLEQTDTWRRTRAAIAKATASLSPSVGERLAGFIAVQAP